MTPDLHRGHAKKEVPLGTSPVFGSEGSSLQALLERPATRARAVIPPNMR